jgi:hypothetical protein
MAGLMIKSRPVLSLAAAGLIVLSHLPACAQSQRSSVSQSLTYLSWKMTGKKSSDTTQTVSQWFAPLFVKVRLAQGWGLALYSAASRSTVDHAGNPDITGLNDSKIQLTHTMADDRILLSAGASLPTGQTKLPAAKRELIPWMSADFFNFPVKIPGEGLELFGEAGVAVPASGWVLGAAGAINYFEKYTPYDDNREYQPGMRVVGTAGIGREWSNRGHIGLDVLVIYSTDDKVEGSPVFGDGLQLDLRLVARRDFTKGGVEAMARFIQRGKNRHKGSSLDLISEQRNTNGNDLRFRCSARHALIGKLQGWASFDTKMLMANGYAIEDPLYENASRIYGAGAGLDLGLGGQSAFGVGARLWRGSSDGAYHREPLDLSGIEIIQRLTIGL